VVVVAAAMQTPKKHSGCAAEININLSCGGRNNANAYTNTVTGDAAATPSAF
jgi:hypothetical protein